MYRVWDLHQVIRWYVRHLSGLILSMHTPSSAERVHYSMLLWRENIVNRLFTPCACGRIPGAFCSPLFVHADLRNFNAVRRTQFYDLIQIVALISLRIVRAIRGTNSHHDKLKMWGVTVLWTARYDAGSGWRHLRFVQLWSNEVSYRKSKRGPLLKIVLATSLQSFMRIEEKMAAGNVTYNEKVCRDTICEFMTL